MHRVRPLVIVLVTILLTGCHSSDVRHPQATSLMGEPLYAMTLDPELQAKREADLAIAIAEHQADPASEDAIIWVGRRQAYLGRYIHAIDTFTDGLDQFPDSYRLLRHRGHRYITIREFEKAEADLARAAALAADAPDAIEPDGLPNAQNLPRSTTHTNIYYHLGLARYLLGDYRGAADAYASCLEYCTNDDMTVATLYWLYLTLQRAEQPDAAALLLGSVQPEMDIIENDDYHRLLLMYGGEFDGLVDPDGTDAIASATVAYGIANEHLLNGDAGTALGLMRELRDGAAWPAFGYIAAEADLARARTTGSLTTN